MINELIMLDAYAGEFLYYNGKNYKLVGGLVASDDPNALINTLPTVVNSVIFSAVTGFLPSCEYSSSSGSSISSSHSSDSMSSQSSSSISSSNSSMSSSRSSFISSSSSNSSISSVSSSISSNSSGTIPLLLLQDGGYILLADGGRIIL